MVEVYVDDGWSGLNFDRPDFNRMLDDIEAGKIDVVITKDLSRLGRDHLKVGHFTEIYFPMKNGEVTRMFDRLYEDSLLCPVCENKTRLRVREDTELIRFPLYCPKCKQETLVNVRQNALSVVQSKTKATTEEK